MISLPILSVPPHAKVLSTTSARAGEGLKMAVLAERRPSAAATATHFLPSVYMWALRFTRCPLPCAG